MMTYQGGFIDCAIARLASESGDIEVGPVGAIEAVGKVAVFTWWASVDDTVIVFD